MYVVLVADTNIDPQGHAEEDVRGPFDSAEEAEDYAMRVDRYLVTVLEVQSPHVVIDGMVQWDD